MKTKPLLSRLVIQYLLDNEKKTISRHVSIPHHFELCIQKQKALRSQHVVTVSTSLEMCLTSKLCMDSEFEGEESMMMMTMMMILNQLSSYCNPTLNSSDVSQNP